MRAASHSSLVSTQAKQAWILPLADVHPEESIAIQRCNPLKPLSIEDRDHFMHNHLMAWLREAQ